MKKYFLIFLLLCILFPCRASKVLFEIGCQDGKSSEFALSGRCQEFLASFTGERGAYLVGYSSAKKHWPYVLPGPMDSWAGGGYWSGDYPRHFPSVFFETGQVTQQGDCTLDIGFVGAGSVAPIRIQFEMNGHRFYQEINGEDDDRLLGSDSLVNGSPRKITYSFPAFWLKKGMNRLRIGTIEGTWAIFDYIRLSSPDAVKLVSPTGNTLVREVRPAPFEQTVSGRKIQPLLVDMVQFDTPRRLTFEMAGEKPYTQLVEAGEMILEIPMRAVEEQSGLQQPSTIVIRDGNQIIFRGEVTKTKQPMQRYTDYVDLLMGTGNSRWMFKPGTALPLSMVQIAPDNQSEKQWKSGYEYTVENIAGFSHISDWVMAGFLMQPTCGDLQVLSGTEKDPDSGYRSRIDKRSEKAQVGHYSVLMTDTDIKAEITSVRRAALQRYTFPERDDARILIDLFIPTETTLNLMDAKVIRVSDHEIEGYATYYGDIGYTLEQNYTLHFVLQFSKPFDSMGGWVNDSVKTVTDANPNDKLNFQQQDGLEIRHNITSIQGRGDLGVFVNYHTHNEEVILVRSGISLVDIEGARRNLKEELTTPFGFDFDKVVEYQQTVWDEYLGRIDIETNDYLQKHKFYTNLYRALAAKAVWSDTDGRYRDEDERIRRLPDPKDAIVSGEYWNTFWNNQLLFNLIAPEISSVWARSAIELYKNSGWFNTDPAGIEHTGVMVAMHMISQIQGAWQSGIHDFDLTTAFGGLKKMMTTPPQKYPGGGTVGVEHLVSYRKYGYVPAGKGLVSNTLEYAYDDWCLAQMAHVLGKATEYKCFMKRSDNWRNIFDPATGFMRPKKESGEWIEPFDPYRTPGFTEGNAFNYTWFVPHNPKELIDAMGRERFVTRLNAAMEHSSKANFNAAGDNFEIYPINHGNQTSMEVSALFNWADSPSLTQKWTRAIQEQYYGTTPYDAYPGDEDLGQMSSWFVMSTLGLFQLDGGCSLQPMYEITSPRYPKATLRLDGKYGRGQKLVIEATNASKDNKYIQRIRWNNVPLEGFLIPQEVLLKGGHLLMEMGVKPK